MIQTNDSISFDSLTDHEKSMYDASERFLTETYLDWLNVFDLDSFSYIEDYCEV